MSGGHYPPMPYYSEQGRNGFGMRQFAGINKIMVSSIDFSKYSCSRNELNFADNEV